MSRDRCCVPGCFTGGKSHAVLHGFPDPEKNPALFNSWIYAVGGDILGLNNQFIYKLRRVCHAHFEQKYCCRFNRISKIAVPTLNLPGPLAMPQFSVVERQPLRTKQNLMNDPTPSTSKAPVIFEDVPTILIEEKENVCLFTDQLVDIVDKTIEQTVSQEGVQVEKRDHSKTTINEVPVFKSRKMVRPCKVVTKSERELHKKLRAAQIKISKCQNKIRKQNITLKMAKKIYTNPEFIKTMDNWTTSAKLFTIMQFREQQKKGKGRRFSTEEKIVALTMLKQSPKAYRFLRKIFILPSRQTLLNLLHRCTLSPGINDCIFKQLKERAKKMKDEHKLCALIFDEMQLRVGISYNERKDAISGFVTDGQETKRVLADHAQVFLIRGLIKNFKQPVAYTFSSGATKGFELAKQIKNVIGQLQQAGFVVITTICDQGTNNRQALKILKEETRSKYLREGAEPPKENMFLINSYEIIPIFDPPHLLKGIRNNLITKNLKYVINEKSGTAKWEHLELLHAENPGYKGMCLMPTLTERHVVPSKIPRMKVKYASQIFSRKISSNMGYLAEKGILPQECKETADFLIFMDNLFDSVNGSFTKNRHAKPLLGPVTNNSPHHKVWKEAKKALCSLQYINKQNNKKESIPTVQGWKETINGLEDIVNELKRDYEITSLWMRHFNQDCLENLFGAIRSQGCRNINPTSEQFESAFATLLINNLTSAHAPGSNCENDNAQSLYSLLLNEDCEVNKTTCEVDLNDLFEIQLTPVASKSDPRILAPLEYVSGYFIKKSKCKVWKTCETCKNTLCGEQSDYIRFREYAGRNWLYSPSDLLINSLSEIQDIANYVIKKYIEKKI